MKKQLDPWPDRLRNLATVMVICIHAAAPIAHAAGQDYNSHWWWSGNFWNSLTRPAVPLFVMLSGYRLLSRDYPRPDFLKRRFTRVVIPAIFCMLIYSFYNYMAHGSPATVVESLKGLVTGPVHYHLWFIYLIIGLYLAYPFLRGWIRGATKQEFWFFFIMCNFCTWGYKMMAMWLDMPMGIYFELFTNNAGYFVAGYYLGNFAIFGKDEPREGFRFYVPPYLPWLLIFLGTFSTMTASYIINTFFWKGQPDVYFYDYLTPNVACGAVGWFLLAKRSFNGSSLLDIEREFSAASFGIYFAHVLVMDYFGQLGFWHSMAHPFFVSPILTAMIAGMTFLAVAIIRVLPGGDRVT